MSNMSDISNMSDMSTWMTIMNMNAEYWTFDMNNMWTLLNLNDDHRDKWSASLQMKRGAMLGMILNSCQWSSVLNDSTKCANHFMPKSLLESCWLIDAWMAKENTELCSG